MEILHLFRNPTNIKMKNPKLEKKRNMKTEMDSYEDEDFETATKICNGKLGTKKK